MSAQELGHAVAALVAAHRRCHPLEEAGHGIHVVATARQGADAEAVGLGLVGAGVVDLPLLHQAHAGTDRGHRRVAGGGAVAGLRGHHRRQHAEQDRDLVALGALDSAQHMLLGDVGDFVRQHRGHLVLALGGQHQAGIDPDVAAQRGEGVDLAVLHHEERVRLARLVAVGAEAGAHGLQPVVHQRVVQQVAVVAQLTQHHGAVLGLARRGQQLARRRADVGQLLLGLGQRHGQGQGDGGSQQQGSQAEGPRAGRAKRGRPGATIR